MHIFAIVLQSWLLFSMAFFSISKLTGAKHQVDLFDSIKLPQGLRIVTGVLQLAGCAGLIIGYWDPAFAAWSAIGIGVMMLVAALAHVRVKHSFGQIFPSLLNVLISVGVVLLFADELSGSIG
ncbi:DoxX family protein [Cohnella sp. GCM10027633]|uniref:DoxX family protein n=1 Tax=unclassified Cohnella TaxID=2636738 RepID=UPI0036445D5D